MINKGNVFYAIYNKRASAISEFGVSGLDHYITEVIELNTTKLCLGPEDLGGPPYSFPPLAG